MIETNNKNYYVCFDVGLTGFFSIIEYEKEKQFKIIHSEKLLIEEKEVFLYKTNIKTKSKAIIKNQISFSANFNRLHYLLRKYHIDPKNCLAMTEQLTPRPFHSKVSILSMGDTNGTIRSVIDSLGIKYIVIPPKIWKDGIGVTSDKKTSIDYFNKNIEIREEAKPFFGKKQDHNQIESVLIAHWYFLLKD